MAVSAISTTAKKRLELLQALDTNNDIGRNMPSVTRMPQPKPSRATVGSADLQQIKNRQEAEGLPEGDVRRPKSKKKSTY